jgi:hypothetical protein
MNAVIDLAVATLGPVLYVLLLAGAALGLVVGVMLVLDSPRVMAWNAALNRWYAGPPALTPLDRSIDVKRAVYRWHRVVGVLLFAGALYTLDVVAFSAKTGSVVRAFRDLGNPALVSLVVEAVRIFLIIGNVAALFAAAVLCFRPSLLKGLEAWGDRQYTIPESGKTALEAMRYGPDRFVGGRPKLLGSLLALGSLYVLASLGWALVAR